MHVIPFLVVMISVSAVLSNKAEMPHKRKGQEGPEDVQVALWVGERATDQHAAELVRLVSLRGISTNWNFRL